MGTIMGKRDGLKQQKGKKKDRTIYTCNSPLHKRTYKFSQAWTYRKHMRMWHGMDNVDLKRPVTAFDFKEK